MAYLCFHRFSYNWDLKFWCHKNMKSRAATVRALALQVTFVILSWNKNVHTSRSFLLFGFERQMFLVDVLSTNYSVNLTASLLWLHVTKRASVRWVNVDIQLAGQIATLVEISETLLLLFHSWRGGCAQNILEWAPPGTIFSHNPLFFVFQERRQGLSGREQKERRGAERGDDKGGCPVFSFI